jgi:MerR family transcriptional regulator, light-induced transcriptional regulator
MSAESLAEPGLTVAAVARRLGIAPATLRTWDRRYGLGPSEHSAGSHRRYSHADLARLEHMRRLVVSGVTPGEAAAACLTLTEVEPSAPSSAGGAVIAMPGASPAARGLARAARALDGESCVRIIRESLDSVGVIVTWESLLAPVLIGIGNAWEANGEGVDVEHILSDSIEFTLATRARESRITSRDHRRSLASTDRDDHTLALWAVAAGLAERGIGARMLGRRVPFSAVGDAMKRTGPAVVFMWSQIPGSADASDIAQLPDMRPAPTILFGGQGWVGEAPAGVERVSSLAETVNRIAQVVGR